jgi:hypothetical protein
MCANLYNLWILVLGDVFGIGSTPFAVPAQAFWEAGRQGEFIEESLGGKGAKGARATVSNKPWYNRLTQLS